jgi:arylsulfatase
MSTCLDLAKVKYPTTYKDHTIKPTEGVSLVPVFKGQTWKGHDALFFEHEGNRAVRQGKWKLVSEFPENKWHLYNINTDRSELNDLSDKQPQKVKELISLYDAWTKRAEVIPFEELVNRKGDKY